MLHASIAHALTHRADALEYAQDLRPRPRPRAHRHLRRHVRERPDARLWRARARGGPAVLRRGMGEAAGAGAGERRVRRRHRLRQRSTTMRARIDRAGLGDIADKLDAGVRLELEDGVRAVRSAGPAGGRRAGQPRAREAPRRAHVLQLQPAARADQRVRGELPVLLVRAPEGRLARRLHDVARRGVAEAARARGSAAHRDPHRQRPAPGAAVLVLRGAARRLQAHQAGRAPEGVHGGRDRVLRRHVRQDRRDRC